jgi:hypothetical protein
MAHYLLNYVSTHETSLKYKFLVINRSESRKKMRRKINIAGKLAHQLLMCKDIKDYTNFHNKVKKIIDSMENPKSTLYDSNSDLCKRLIEVVENLNNRSLIEKSDSVKILNKPCISV